MGFGIFGFFGTVSTNMLGSWPMGLGIFGFFGTVSMNMFIHRPMGFVIFVFFWDCLEEHAHFVSFDRVEKYVDFLVCKHVCPFMSQLL